MHRGTPDPDLHLPPTHLVDAPAARGWRRLGVGTAAFNVGATLVLVAITGFVVLGPTGPADETTTIADREAAVAPRASAERRSPRVTAPRATTTSTAAGATSTTESARPTFGALTPATALRDRARGITSGLAKGRLGLGTGERISSARPVTCDRFPTQPEAQAAFVLDEVGLVGLDGDKDGVVCEHLPGLQIAAPPVPKPIVPGVDELLLPDTRLYGVHTPNAPYNWGEVEAFGTAAGKVPNTVMFFTNLSRAYPQEGVTKAWENAALPIVTFEPIVQDSADGQPLLADIAGGDWDEYFRAWARAAKAHGLPFGMRFAQEMNGNWYPWSDGRFGNDRGDFVQAWRHLHDLFEQEGATNAIWIWSVNRVDNLPDRTLARVYPGDDYVDWAGVSGYYRQAVDGVAPSFDATFAMTLAQLSKVAPKKLIMITETGAGTTQSHRTAWIESFFEGLLEHPQIIGFSWFNDFKDGNDWRIQYSRATQDAFAAGVGDPRYGVVARRPA